MMAGYWRGEMKQATNILCIVAAFSFVQSAQASNQSPINTRAGQLGDAIVQLGQQTGSNIGISDQSLARLPVRGLRGRMSVDEAMRRLLNRTPARAVRLNSKSWRIVAANIPPPFWSAKTALPEQKQHKPRPAAYIQVSEPVEIVVTASKRDTPLKLIPANVSILSGDAFAAGLDAGGTAEILEKLPSVTSTHAGTGRNKLFIRGIADSGFTGPTQATVGQYFGEMRVNYNAPDPDLRLYDIASVEVMEGPQGTLYGAGSLGGIIRANPNLPDRSHTQAFASYSVASTVHGGESVDGHTIINVPLVPDKVAIRVLAYGAHEGGYIDDIGRNLKDVNGIDVVGGRAIISIVPHDDWRVDISGVGQAVRGDDAQYAQRGSPGMSRNSPMAQKYGSDYVMANIKVSGTIGDLRLISSVGVVNHDLIENYDATKLRQLPMLFRQENRISILSTETGLSRDVGDGNGWLIGASYIDSVSRLKRSLIPAAVAIPLPGVENSLSEWALFGEASFGVVPDVYLTVGGRASSAKLSGNAFDVPALFDVAKVEMDAGRTETIFLPAIAVAVTPYENLTTFVRYQQGFRPGGLAIDGPSIRHFRNDRTSTLESGFRLGDIGRDRIAVMGAVAFTDWRNIQADLTDGMGFPTTANIGDGHILSVEGQVFVRPTESLSFDAAFIFSHSRLDSPSPLAQAYLAVYAQQAAAIQLTVPNVARFGSRASVTYRHPVSNNSDLIIAAATRYVGKSRLGIGPVLGAEQGGYLNSSLVVKWQTERADFFVNISNVFNVEGNRYALGTPFALPDGDEYTPLRPRSVTIGFKLGF